MLMYNRIYHEEVKGNGIMHIDMVPPGQHRLPPLSYPVNALEPVISARSLRIHHNVLHKGYVDRLNRAEDKLVESRKTGDFEFIQYWENQLAFNGSGHILHSIYWTVMNPLETGGIPGPRTMFRINEYFSSFNAFREQFVAATEKVEASGWGVLSWQPTWGHLEILQAGKHQNLTQWSGIPILVCDVWEHAYYLDYTYRRREFILNWWKLINWFEVERRLLLAVAGQVPLTGNHSSAVFVPKVLK